MKDVNNGFLKSGLNFERYIKTSQLTGFNYLQLIYSLKDKIRVGNTGNIVPESLNL